MYLDPGALNAFVLVLVGALVAVPTLLTVYWGRIKSFLSRSRNATVENEKKG